MGIPAARMARFRQVFGLGLMGVVINDTSSSAAVRKQTTVGRR